MEEDCVEQSRVIGILTLGTGGMEEDCVDQSRVIGILTLGTGGMKEDCVEQSRVICTYSWHWRYGGRL